jgi:hypothetical protein
MNGRRKRPSRGPDRRSPRIATGRRMFADEKTHRRDVAFPTRCNHGSNRNPSHSPPVEHRQGDFQCGYSRLAPLRYSWRRHPAWRRWLLRMATTAPPSMTIAPPSRSRRARRDQHEARDAASVCDYCGAAQAHAEAQRHAAMAQHQERCAEAGRHWPLIPSIRPGPRQAGLQDWPPTARVGTERRVPKRRRAVEGSAASRRSGTGRPPARPRRGNQAAGPAPV